MFPLLMWKCYNKIHWTSWSDSLGIPLLDPQAGKPDLRFRTFTAVGELLFLQFVGCPPGRYAILFYHDCSPYHLTVASSLSLDIGYFWGVGVAGWVLVSSC